MKYRITKGNKTQIIDADGLSISVDGLTTLFNDTSWDGNTSCRNSRNVVAIIPKDYLVINESRVGMDSEGFNSSLFEIQCLLSELKFPRTKDDMRIPIEEVITRAENFLKKYE